jgi:hypothetical protein
VIYFYGPIFSKASMQMAANGSNNLFMQMAATIDYLSSEVED